MRFRKIITLKLSYYTRVIYWSCTSWRWVPEPAHSHSQSSLQPVWAMWRYLSRYPVADVAFGAPGTCKQCTHQTTAICGDVRWTTLFSLNTHAACARALASYLAYDALQCGSQLALLSLCLTAKVSLASKPCHTATKYHQGTSPGNATARGRLVPEALR